MEAPPNEYRFQAQFSHTNTAASRHQARTGLALGGKLDKRIFPTFKEASSFAKRQAQASGETLKLERDGDGWVVFPNQSTTSPATR